MWVNAVFEICIHDQARPRILSFVFPSSVGTMKVSGLLELGFAQRERPSIRKMTQGELKPSRCMPTTPARAGTQATPSSGRRTMLRS